ncbi:polyprenyl synthetase family protein [Parenemella sanctibonifatiensis]|uniref:Polyprenyl synthetase family protein n=1 Tax=Parenemella sanctibonifatiensis TaxID=2016505 RepID=A0A255EFY9_9ACTN|nr:polyprenyl synthetase family protein [Parenemella sanctibonifatiensis]OYN88352.1 hypothetical protein CGZ92_05325 [Parenemella sanctibonifatiensis]
MASHVEESVLTELDPHDPLGAAIHDGVAAQLERVWEHQGAVLEDISPELTPVLAAAREFCAGGKRFRPACVLWGYAAATGSRLMPDWLVQLATSTDLLHASALVHDDIIDRSDTRRGAPSMHRRFEAEHCTAGLLGDPAEFGQSSAILLGDLLLMWSTELAGRASQDPEVHAQLAALRTEVTAGQLLDVLGEHRPIPATEAEFATAIEQAEAVLERKTASYTVRHPLLIGARAAGTATPDLIEGLSRLGSAVGWAFQLRDDVLGVFGSENETGKPAGDDLREGKRTLLVLYALQAADDDRRTRLAAVLGKPADAAAIADASAVIEETGARGRVEERIADLTAAARDTVAELDVTEAVRQGLAGLVELAVRRRG